MRVVQLSHGGNRMANIIPIRDLKNTSKVSEMCHQSDKPIYITKNGYSDSVIMSNEVYEKEFERIEKYYKGILSAMENSELIMQLENITPEDIENGLVNAKDSNEAFFYEMLGNMILQSKQRKIVAQGNIY